MTSLEEQQQQQQQQQQHHPLAISALDFINSDAGWKVYMTVHITQRDILFKRIYLLESFDRETAIPRSYWIIHYKISKYIHILNEFKGHCYNT